MTETLQRPARPSVPARPERRPPPLLESARAALVAALLGLLVVTVPVLLLWVVEDRAGASLAETLRTAGQLWLVANGASLQVPGGVFALTPLGLLALPVWLLVRAGRTPVPGGAVRRAVTIAAPYAVVTGLVAVGAATQDVRAAVLPTTATSFALAATAVLLGGRARLVAAPARVRGLGRTVLAASAVLVGAGALLAATMLAVHLPRAADLAASTAPGVLGGVGLLLIGLALVPNAVLWSAGWLAGPGFAVGAGTAVGPFGHQLGPVPALPLLAALPGSGLPGWVGALALTVPLLAGVLAGFLVQRELPDASAGRVTGQAALVAGATGALWTLLAWSSGGSVGGGRLVEVGPGPWSVGLAVTGLVGVGAVLSAGVLRHRARP